MDHLVKFEKLWVKLNYSSIVFSIQLYKFISTFNCVIAGKRSQIEIVRKLFEWKCIVNLLQ